MPLDDATRRSPAAVAAIGHNGGPPLEDPPRGDWAYCCWRRAHERAWKTPPREIALRRLRRAEALGMTYREYQAIILDRGVYVQERPAEAEIEWSSKMRRRIGCKQSRAP
jgi:hypothetical protein